VYLVSAAAASTETATGSEAPTSTEVEAAATTTEEETSRAVMGLSLTTSAQTDEARPPETLSQSEIKPRPICRILSQYRMLPSSVVQ